MTLAARPVTAARVRALRRRAQALAWATIGYNAAEGAFAVATGALAGSTALVGFGLDSAAEVGAAAVLAWRFAGGDPARRERVAVRLIAWSFFLTAGYVAVSAAADLLRGEVAAPSPPGIALAAVSLLVMPALAVAKRRVGRALGSAAVVAEAGQTVLCTYLSAVLLLGLALRAALGWTWADPVAALVIAVVAAVEGVRTWRGDSCCAPLDAVTATAPPEGDAAAACCAACAAR